MFLVPILFAAQAPRLDPLPRDPRLFREWATVATNGMRYSERLRLLPDGQFVSRRTGAEASFKRVSGFYLYGTPTGPKSETRIVSFWVSTKFGGALHYTKARLDELRARGQTTVPYRILLFEPKPPFLHDLMATIFAPRGHEARVKRLLEQSRKP